MIQAVVVHSPVRASLRGASVAVPFENKGLMLGTWQQIVLPKMDTRPMQEEMNPRSTISSTLSLSFEGFSLESLECFKNLKV
jgi:hypothetical protein